jgi:hypothetical protein
MRYGDLIRNTQMQWYMKSSWIANAMDQGFHRYVFGSIRVVTKRSLIFVLRNRFQGRRWVRSSSRGDSRKEGHLVSRAACR